MGLELKPLSVTTNVVGLQTDDAGHLGQNSSARLARVVGLQTDAVVVTETRLNCTWNYTEDITMRIMLPYCIFLHQREAQFTT